MAVGGWKKTRLGGGREMSGRLVQTERAGSTMPLITVMLRVCIIGVVMRRGVALHLGLACVKRAADRSQWERGGTQTSTSRYARWKRSYIRIEAGAA